MAAIRRRLGGGRSQEIRQAREILLAAQDELEGALVGDTFWPNCVPSVASRSAIAARRSLIFGGLPAPARTKAV